MTKYNSGDENIPLRQYDKEKRPIVVFLIDLSIDENEGEPIVKQFKLDYSDFYDRKHLGRITFWAVTNNHAVEVYAEKDIAP